MSVRIAGVAYHLPQRVEPNTDLVADNDDWRMADIFAKTGVVSRHVSSEQETALDLAAHAAEKLFASGVNRGAIDAVVLVTSQAVPAYSLQTRLGLSPSCMAFSVNLACSGFVYGLGITASLVKSSMATQALLLCSDTWTKMIDRHDRACRPLFGDGAAAVLVTRAETETLGPFVFGTDASRPDDLFVWSEKSCTPGEVPRPQVFMDGSKVFLFTMAEVPRLVSALCRKADIRLDDVDLFVFHQASKLVLDNLERRLKLPTEKVYRNYRNHGNTVSATIPIALRDAADEGRLKPGDLVLIAGFGLGYSWGATLLRWAPEVYRPEAAS